jgi:hypothetical protein
MEMKGFNKGKNLNRQDAKEEKVCGVLFLLNLAHLASWRFRSLCIGDFSDVLVDTAALEMVRLLFASFPVRER